MPSKMRPALEIFVDWYRWFSRYVIAAMLVDENKRFLISSFCSSTSNCTLQHCYLCPSRLVANHLYFDMKRAVSDLDFRQFTRQFILMDNVFCLKSASVFTLAFWLLSNGTVLSCSVNLKCFYNRACDALDQTIEAESKISIISHIIFCTYFYLAAFIKEHMSNIHELSRVVNCC